MGFTKKQRRDQKKLHAELRVKARRELKLKTGEKQAKIPVVIRTVWTTPEGEQPPEDTSSKVSRATDLQQLQKRLQNAMEKRVSEEHPDWSVVVTITEVDPLIETTASEDNVHSISQTE